MLFFKKDSENIAPNVTQKDVDILKNIVERNKIKNSGASIDDVVNVSRNLNVSFKSYL